MPQDRTLLHTGRDMQIERVRSHLAPAEWSGAYSTHSQRLVLPMPLKTFRRTSRSVWSRHRALTPARLASAKSRGRRPRFPLRIAQAFGLSLQ